MYFSSSNHVHDVDRDLRLGKLGTASYEQLRVPKSGKAPCGCKPRRE